jgi:tetratricopeptide (TPR) repeat protein
VNVVGALLFSASLAFAQTAAPANDFSRAVALQQAGDHQGAAAAYRAFLEAHPSNIEARSNLGVVLAQLGRYEEAIEAYRVALGIDPKQLKVRSQIICRRATSKPTAGCGWASRRR